MLKQIIISSLLYSTFTCNAFSATGVFDIISETEEKHFTDKALLLAINKVTTKHKKLEVNIGETIYFGNISITAYKCNKVQNPYHADNQIFLSVLEHSINSDPKEIFKGWMISSSPSLSTLEHPIYQVIALECIDDQS